MKLIADFIKNIIIPMQKAFEVLGMNVPEGMHADEIFDSQESDLVDEKRVEMLDLMELFYANKTGKQDAKTKKEIETLNTRLDKQEARIVRVENGLEELTDEVRLILTKKRSLRLSTT